MRFPTDSSKKKKRYSLYECPTCLEHKEFQVSDVKSGNTTGCKSCQGKKQFTKHGGTGTKLFNVWRDIQQRCYNKNHKSYRYYGAKGVTMCDKWRHDYATFRDWSTLNGYSEGLEIDKDEICNRMGIVPKIYSPSTCIWMTKLENSKVKRRVDG